MTVMRSLSSGLLVFVLIGASAACVGDDPVATTPTSDGGVGPGGGDGSTTNPGDDGGPQPCTPGAKSCADGTTLATCGEATPVKCELDCSTTGGAHCTEMQPALPVVTADLSKPDVVPLTISADGFVNTATGAIDNVRPPNIDPGTEEVKSGIGFRLVGNVGVFFAKSFRVESGATLKLRGPAAFAIAVAERIEIIGIVDARGYDAGGILCGNSDTSNVAGPGGSLGGSPTGANNGAAPGGGGGKGVAGFTLGSTEGPGGGGFGGAGGNGGNFNGSGGVVVPFPGPIAGGFGGGASGSGAGTNGAKGGGGGGAVQLSQDSRSRSAAARIPAE
jgi:hypothetical protein